MSAPMTPEQRTEIGDAAQPGYANILAQLIKHGAHDDPKHGKVIVHGVTVVPAADLKAAVRVVWFGAPALLVEVERLRAEVKRLRAALGTEVRRNSGRTVPSGAPDSVVRSWAREHDIPVNPKGRIAPDVRAAYEAAWRAEQDGGDPC